MRCCIYWGATDTYPLNSGYPGTQNKDNAMYCTSGKMLLTGDQLVKEIWNATIGSINNIFKHGVSAYKQPTGEPNKQPTQEQLKQFIQQNGTAAKIKDP